jgi:hypothetical protein
VVFEATVPPAVVIQSHPTSSQSTLVKENGEMVGQRTTYTYAP